MRLIKAETLHINIVTDQDVPPYAILSHTWGKDEVTFDDWKHASHTTDSAGFAKIQKACQQTLSDNLQYIWADTVCIDKTSSAELSEAINSMYAWYRDAQVCYVYLSDVDAEDAFDSGQFHSSRWFTRGWTLQELLAPKEVIFYASDWTQIGTRRELAQDISLATRIPRRYLTGSSVAQLASVSMKMSWISKRQTTRTEDIAYSMLGLFDINMSLLYGEGRKAFIRLQEEILKVSPDHTLFCWSWKPSVPANWVSLLAPAPDVFEHTGDFSTMADRSSRPYPYMMTNFGLSITLPIIQCWSFSFVVLSAASITDGKVTCIPVKLRPDFKFKGIYERTAFPPGPVLLEQKHCGLWRNHIVRSLPNLTATGMRRPRGIQYGDFDGISHGFLLIFRDIAPFMDKDSPIYARSMKKMKYRVVEKLRIQQSVPLLAYPPGSFDESASLFKLEAPHKCSGILRIGEACVVHFSIRQSNRNSNRWVPYCTMLSHAAWTVGQRGQEVLDGLDQTLRPASTTNKTITPLFSIQIGDRITVADPNVCVWPAYASGTRNMNPGDECYDSFQESDWSLEDS